MVKLIQVAALLTLSASACAAKNCTLDGTAGLIPAYGQTLVQSGSLSAGDTLASMGESNTKQIFDHVSDPDIVLVNSATGGCTIGSYSRSSTKCWGNMPKSADVIWMKPINRSKGIDPETYKAALEQDIVGALTQISNRMTGVREVWMSAHHATPYSDVNSRGVPPKQGEPYSHDSIIPIQNVAQIHANTFPFKLVISSYLWAPANTPRADGAQWHCEDFNNDGVHLSPTGYRKAAGMVEASIADAKGAVPDDDDDPVDPEPQQCEQKAWATRKGKVCSFVESKDRCICR